MDDLPHVGGNYGALQVDLAAIRVHTQLYAWALLSRYARAAWA